jgi:hypothetical protein
VLRGEAPDCHCFGQLHSAPAGPKTLARNGALFTLAAFVAAGGDPAATAVAGGFAALLLVAVAYRDRDRATGTASGDAQLEGLPLGAPAPGFELAGLDGATHSLASLRTAGQPVLLVFSDSACGPCVSLAPEVGRWQRDHARELTIAVIERDRDGRGPLGPDGHGRSLVLFEPASEVADLYGAQGSPAAVLVARDGTIASTVAAGALQIEDLVSRHAHGFRRRARRARPRVPLQVRRRELLVRGAAAWAATSAVLAWPLRAVAVASGRTPRAANPRCDDKFDCPHRDGFADCVNGRCRCGEHYTYCSHGDADDRHCFDLQTSRDQCGSCNHTCTGADHDFCCEGECGEFGKTRCNCGEGAEECPGDEVCTDIGFGIYGCFPCSFHNMERCGSVCGDPATQRCCGGKLYNKADLGPGDWRCCGPATTRRLVNVHEHEQHCGGCDKQCKAGEFCFGGSCRTQCPRGTKRCGNTCVDGRRQKCCDGKPLSTSGSDPDNCGDCGAKCNGPFDTGECCSGKCCDYNADTCCGNGCKNLALDDKNCGGCGNVCGPNSYCRFGVCTCPVEPCP